MSTKETDNIPKKRRVLPWLALIVLILGSAGMTAYYWNLNLVVNNVEVRGNYFTPTDQVLSEAAITFDVHPDSLDLQLISSSIRKLNYVHSVVPFVDPTGTLKLDISERFPIAMLVQGNEEVYVDAYGVRLPILPGKTFDLPLVYGFETNLNADTLRSEEFRQIRNFLVGAYNNEFGWATISEVAFDPEEGVVALSHENGVKLLFGRNDFDIKLRNWEAFYSEVILTKGIEAMQQVDLRFTNQVVTREVGS